MYVLCEQLLAKAANTVDLEGVTNFNGDDFKTDIFTDSTSLFLLVPVALELVGIGNELICLYWIYSYWQIDRYRFACIKNVPVKSCSIYTNLKIVFTTFNKESYDIFINLISNNIF